MLTSQVDEEILTQKRRRQYDHESRAWSDIATVQAIPGVGGSWKIQGMNLCLENLEEIQPHQYLVWTLGLQNGKRINFCWLRAPSLWRFVMAAPGNECTFLLLLLPCRSILKQILAPMLLFNLFFSPLSPASCKLELPLAASLDASCTLLSRSFLDGVLRLLLYHISRHAVSDCYLMHF